MKKCDLISILVGLILGLIVYFVTYSYIFGIAVILMVMAYYFILGRKRIKIYIIKIKTTHCCYHFINSFIITLSVKESLEEAYQSGVRTTYIDFQEEVDSISSMDVHERVIYLRKYFNLAVYKMFVNVLDLYIDQGGNILTIADSLLKEATRTEKTLNESTKIGERKLGEFILLWIITFGILLFMRFGLTDFYVSMLKTQLFLIMLFIFLMIFLVSVHIFILRFTDISLKEDTL